MPQPSPPSSPRRCSPPRRCTRRPSPRRGPNVALAIARALAADPVLLLADEPTGELDSVTGGGILALLGELVATRGLTLLMATHEPDIIADADRTIELHDGRVVQPVDQR